MGDRTMTNFDAETLRRLRETQEFHIRTGTHPNTAVVIWVVVAADNVFVRSWAGTRGRWYRDLAAGGPATLEFGETSLAVQAIPAGDPASVERASHEFLSKYRQSSHAQEMVRAGILATTLRLVPR
jgi:hypothetical protein